MFDYFKASLPVLLLLVGYFVRLEVTIAVIKRDLCWIKKQLVDLKP